MAEKEIVMNGAGIEEIGFPGWPQFAPETLEDVLEPIKTGKVSYWTVKKVWSLKKCLQSGWVLKWQSPAQTVLPHFISHLQA